MEDSFETRLPQSYSPSSGTFNVHGSESLSLGTSTSSSSSSRGSITKNPVYRQQRYNELLAIVEAATVDPDVVVQFGDDVDGNGGGGQPATIVTYTRVQENEIAVVIEDEPHHVNDLEEANFVTGPETVGRTVDRQESLSMSASLQYPTRLRPAKDLVVQGGSEMSAVVRRDTEKPIDYNSSHVVWLTPREEIICEDRKEPRPTVEQSQPVHVTSVIAEPNAGSNSLEVKTSAKLDTERQVTVAPGLVREVRHKRHVIEEIVVEDCEKYYEELSSSSSLHKRRRVKRSTTPVVEDTVTPSPRISQLNADPSVATVRGDDIQRTGTDPTLNRLSVTYIVQHGSPHGSLRDSSPKTDEPDVTGATMRSDDQSKTVTYIVHHDAAASSRNSRSSSSNRNSSMEPQGGDISQAPRVNTATLDMPDTVTYVTHHDLLRRLTPPGFTSTGATIGTEQMSEKRLAGPSLASEAVDFDQTPLHTVTYVVNYDVPGEGSKVVKETASLSRAPHPMTSKTSAAESSRNRVVGHIEREHRGDRSVVDLSSPVEGSQSVTFVTQYEITTDKRGLTESSSSSAAGKSLSSHDRTELELHHEFMRPPAEQREEDPQPANKMFLMASKTDRDSIKYVVEYDIEDKKRKKTKSSRVYVTVQPTLECNTSEGANIQLTVGDADEKHHTRVKTVPPASRDYVTYVVEYEIMPKKRRQLAAADQKRPEVLQLEHTPAVAGPSTGIEPDVPKYEAEPLNSSRTRPNPTAVPEFSTYVVEYEIRKKMRNEQDEAEQIASTSASHTTASDATDTQRNIESALAGRQPVVVPVLANNAASVTYVVEYEITAKKPRKEQLKAAIVSVVPASGPRELGMQTASDLQTTELNPNDEEPIYNSYAASQMMSCTDSVPQSITYTVEYDLKSRKNRQTMGAPITCGTDDERAAEPIADEEIRVASSDIDFHPTVMEHVDRQYAVPVTAYSNTVTYVVEYDLSSSKKGSSKATASAKTKETNEQVYTLTSARGNEVKDLTDNVPGLVVDVQEGSQQHYQPITAQDNTMKYVVEYSVLPTNNKKTKSTHAKLATETEVKTVDVASIGELPGDPSAIDVAPPMEFREIVDSQHSDPSTKPLNNNPVTYVVQYEIASKRRNKQKGHEVTASYATDSRANYPAAIRCEVFSPTVDSEQPYETAVHVGEHNAAPVNAEVETFVNYVEYDVTRRNKKRIKTVQVVEAGGATDENTFALQPAGEALMKQSTHEVAVHSNESDIKLQQTKAPVVVETSNFTYVVEYEITSRNKRKIKSNQVTQSRKETVAEPLAITSTGQLETGAVAQHGENRANISGIVDNQPCDPAASNTVTYVVQYEILSKQNKRLKASQATKTGESKQEVSFATVAAPELKTTSPEIDVETPAGCIQIDSEQLATSATPHNNTVTYVVEYSVLSKKNKKSKSTDHAKQTGETEVKAVDVTSTEEHHLEPSAIDVVLPMEFQELVDSQQAEPMTDSLNSNTVTYVVQYEIASKRHTILQGSQVLVPGTTGVKVSSPVAIRDDVISTTIDAEHPVEAVVSVGQQNTTPDTAQVDTVTYVVQYDVTRRNKVQTKTSLVAAGETDVKLHEVKPARELEMEQTTQKVEFCMAEAESVLCHGAALAPSKSSTVTYVVEYEIASRNDLKTKSAQVSQITGEKGVEPLAVLSAGRDETDAVAMDVENRTETLHEIVASQPTDLSAGDSVTYVVKYEISSKKRSKLKESPVTVGEVVFPTAKRNELISSTITEHPRLASVTEDVQDAMPDSTNVDSVKYVVEYDVTRRNKKRIRTAQAVVTAGEIDEKTIALDHMSDSVIEPVTQGVEVCGSEAEAVSHEGATPISAQNNNFTYVVEYEVTSRNKRKIKSNQVTQSREETAAGPLAITSTGQLEIGAVAQHGENRANISGIVDNQPCDPAASNSVTYVVQYEILSKQNKRLKASQATKTGESKQEVSFATVAAPELKTTSPEIDVETPAECIQIDSEQLATSATPHNNTVTYVVEYSVLSKKNKKSKSTDHAKQTGETEVKAVDVASTEEHPVEPSAIDVVLPMEFQELVASQQAEPMTDSLNSNTVTYVVQYEIASKRQTKLKESQVLVPGTTGGRVSSPVAIRDDVISTMIDAEHPVEAVVSVGQQNAAPDSSAQADTVTYVVQYDVTRRNMKKTTRAKAVDSSNKTQVEAVASTSDLEAELKPSALHVNRPTEDAETVEHAAPVDTVTFIVEYDITKSRKKHMKNIPKSATTFETDLEQHASPLESDVAIQPSTIDVVVPVEIPKIICSQDTALKTGHENMVTYIVEYEMPSKKGTKPKTAIMGLSSGRTKYSLESSPVGKQFVESLTVDDEPNIETPQVASHLLSKPVEFPDSITFVVDYKISPKLKRKLDSPAVIITGTSEDGLQDQQDNTNRGAVEEVIPPTFVAQESVTYQIEYEMTSKKSKKVKTAFVTAETPESKIDDSHMAVATDERSIRAVIGAPSADLAKTELGSVVDIQSRRSNPTNPAKSDRDTITFTVDYDILAKKAGKWVLPAPTTTIISSQGAKDETILKSLEFDHVSVEASTRTYVVESSDVTVPVEVIVDDSVLDGSFEWERRGCVEEPEVVVEVTPTAAASSGQVCEQTIKYVVEYEIAAKRRSRFESPSKNIAANVSAETAKKSYGKVLKNQPANTVEVEATATADEQAMGLSARATSPNAGDDAPVSMTYTVEYAVQTNKYGKGKVSKPEYHVEVTHELDRREQEITEAVEPDPTSIDVDVVAAQNVGSMAVEEVPKPRVALESLPVETMTYSVQYEISRKIRKTKTRSTSRQLGVDSSVSLVSTAQPTAVVAGTVDLSISNTDVGAKTNEPDNISSVISTPFVEIVATPVIAASVPDTTVESVSYVVQYEIVRKKKTAPSKQNTTYVAVSENNKATASNTVLKSVNTGEITLIQKSAEVVPQPEYNDIRVSGSSTIVGDSDAAVETKTYIVDYDIQVDRKTKRNKRGMETDDDDHQLVLDDIPLPPDNHDITADDLDLIESQTTVSPNDIISRVVQYDIIQQHLDDVTEQHLDSSSPRTHEMNVQIELGSQRFDAPEGFIIDVGINHEEVPHSEVDAPATHAAPTSVEYGVEYKISEVIDSKDLRFSGDETRSDYQFSPRSYIPEFELKATGEHVDEGSQLAMPEVSSKPVSFTVNSDISQEAGRSRQEAHDIILTSNDEGFNFTQHQVTSQPSSPSYSESLYLQILRIAAESADNGHRNGRTKSDSQPMKVTYITSHPIPSRNGDGKPKVQLGEDQPQINLSTITEERSGDMSEDMPRLQDSDVNLHETSRPKVCEYEVEVEINVDSVHRPSSLDVEHNQTINSSVHTNNQASFDANHETMGIKHTNDLWLTGENSDQSLPLGDIEQNAPAPGSRIGKVNNKKLFELRGGKIKKTTQTPEVETELETITFIVNYDINELLEDQRHKNYILTGKKRGQKYEVGRKEANIVSDEKIKTELPRDEEDELFDATMRMIIESTGRGSEPPITTPEVHLVPDVQVEAAILEFDRLLPDVSVPTASSVYSTKMPLTASMCENEVVADISINEQYTEQRHSPSNRAEDRIVTSLAQPERQGGHQYQYKSSDDDDVTSDSTTVVMNGKTLNWTTSGNHKENTIYIGPTSTQTSGYSERVMYSDWTAENENGYLTRDVEVSPTSTILSGSPDFSESRVTELKTSATILRPPTVLIDCQDSGIEQEASSPTFSGTSSEFEAGTRSTSSARTMGVGMASRTEVVPEKSVNLNTSSSGNRLRRYAVPMQPVENFKNEWSRTTPLGTKSSHRVDPLPVPTDDQHFVVVAIDFGTTFSGYAFSFTSATGKPMTSGSATPTNDGHGGTTSSHPEVNTVHVMRRWEGGDPGVINYKAPTTLLLNPVGEFHSFGFSARDFYHDLSSRQAKTWMYFEKFKMTLHSDAKLNVDSKLTASNGQQVSALKVFSTALAFFRSHALQEISDQSGTPIVAGDVKWIVTVPSIWRDPAKEFMRTAAYQAGIASADNPKQLVIALEPEVASLYVRRLHLHQLVPDTALLQRPWTTRSRASVSPERNRASITATFAPSIGEMIITTSSGTNRDSIMTSQTTISPSRWSFNRNDVVPVYSELTVGDQTDTPGMRYMIVDCGGGTVDITVHELDRKSNTPGELHKSTTGGPFGSIGVDMAFETLLVDIFGADFVNAFKAKRPAGWVDLMMAFESRKRAAHPMKTKTLNVPLPFSFIDYHKKHRSFPVEVAVRRYGNRDVSWSSQGMLRLAPRAMRHLFQATLDGIKQAIARVLNNPDVRGVQFMFLVGGFSESPMLQLDIRNEFKHLVKIIIPVEVSLAILKGAVYFGINISTATVRYSRMTYAVNVVRPFIAGIDSTDKLIYLEGADWCADAVDVFVFAGQPLRIGETVARRYCPTSSSWITSSLLAGQQAAAMFDIYRSGDCADIRYVTDRGLVKCGSVNLDINSSPVADIRIQMTFWENEILVVAMDDESGNTASIKIDFLSERTRSNVDD